MTTKSSNYMNMFDDLPTVITNKGTQAITPKKCARCDETVKNEEQCPRCHALTEDAKPLLLD
jgi:uncharacterized paraquat-inducible protein A